MHADMPSAAAAPDGAEPASLQHATRRWARSVHGLLMACVDLAAGEARLAGYSLALMLGCAAALAVFTTAAWMSGVAGLLLWLQAGHSVWVGTLAGVALASLVASVGCLLFLRSASINLGFPGTRQALEQLMNTGSDADEGRVES